MPLLKSSSDKERVTSNLNRASSRSPSPTRRKKSIFSNSRKSSGGIFRGRSSKKLLDNDESIRNARRRVSEAEQAEQAADRSLHEARTRAKLAQDHVRNLEREAVEEARRANAKQAEAKVITKTMKTLGRHGS